MAALPFQFYSFLLCFFPGTRHRQTNKRISLRVDWTIPSKLSRNVRVWLFPSSFPLFSSIGRWKKKKKEGAH